MPVCQTRHQPGLAAHFHGRKGSFSSPVCQSFPALPPLLPHLTRASPVEPDCSPADLIQTLQTSSSSRSQNTSSGPRLYSCLQPWWPSVCSCWVCSPKWHLPAVNKVAQDKGTWAAGKGGQGHGLQERGGRGLGCREERAGWKTVAEVGWDGGLRYHVLEGEQHTGPQSS